MVNRIAFKVRIENSFSLDLTSKTEIEMMTTINVERKEFNYLKIIILDKTNLIFLKRKNVLVAEISKETFCKAKKL